MMAADDIEACKATCMECSVTSMLLEVNAVLGAYRDGRKSCRMACGGKFAGALT